MKYKTKISILVHLAIGLFLTTSLVSLSIGTTPPEDEHIPDNPVSTFGYPEYIVYNDFQCYIGENGIIEMLDVISTSHIEKTATYDGGDFCEIEHFNNLIFTTERGIKYNTSHYQFNFHILKIETNRMGLDYQINQINTDNQIVQRSKTQLFTERHNRDIHLWQSKEDKLYMFLEDKEGGKDSILVYNCTIETAPEFVCEYTLELLDTETELIRDFQFEGDIMCLFAPDDVNCQYIFYDISDILNPTKIGRLVSNHENLGGFIIEDSRIYHIFHEDFEVYGVAVYDFSNPANPTFVEKIETNTYINSLVVSNDILYICQGAKINIYEGTTLKKSFDLDVQVKYDVGIGSACFALNRIYYSRSSTTQERVFSVIEIRDMYNLSETVYGVLGSTNNSSLSILAVLSGLATAFTVAYICSKKKVERFKH